MVVFLKLYLFKRQNDGEHRTLFHPLVHSPNFRKSPEPGVPSWSATWAAVAQALGRSSAFPGALAFSWIRRRAGRTWRSDMDAGISSFRSTCYTTVPAPERIVFYSMHSFDLMVRVKEFQQFFRLWAAF